MKLYEFQGKRIFRENGIPVDAGKLLKLGQQIENISAPKVLKAQVLTGGRGKAGGIKIWDGLSDVSQIIENLFELKIKGESVGGILLQEMVEIQREFYLSITYKGTKATPVLIVSAAGGVEIEKIAQEDPEKIVAIPLNPLVGPSEYQVRYVAKKIGYENYRELKLLIDNVYKVFRKYDATLVEINPLAVTPDGLVAVDAKVNLDDKSEFRHKELFEGLLKEQLSLQKDDVKAATEEQDTITYVPLSGTVGLISDGAGTGMLTLDIIKDAGGEAANFCELGGTTNAEIMYKAMTMAMEKPGMDSLIVVLIGGFNRMDHMAEGIIKYRNDHGFKVPVFVRMCGTLEQVGKEMMKESDIPVFNDLQETVNHAVALVRRK